MKKIKFTSLILLPMALASCSADQYIGSYSFQLGNNSDTHFGIFAKLTNKDYVYQKDGEEAKVLGKTMTINVDVGGQGIGSFIDDLDLKAFTITAYYEIGGVTADNDRVFKFGFNIGDILNNLVPEDDPSTPSDPEPTPIVKNGENQEQGSGETGGNTGETGGESGGESGGETSGEGEDPFPDISNVTPEQTAKFVYTTINASTLTFNIPVSLNDLQFQLYWYGLDLSNLDATIDAHDVGTHPTQEDIKKINEELKYADNHDGKSFRDYHTLSLGLTKK